MLGGETGKNKIREKNKVKFRNSSKIISLVCNTLVHCEGVDFKVTGITFMTAFITRRDAASYGHTETPAYQTSTHSLVSQDGLQALHEDRS